MALGRAMYTPEPSASELTALGLKPEDYAHQGGLEVWPEHWQAFEVFCAMQTQWRIGSAGMGGSVPTGLDYHAMSAVMEFLNVSADERGDLFADVQAMESAALEAMADARVTN